MAASRDIGRRLALGAGAALCTLAAIATYPASGTANHGDDDPSVVPGAYIVVLQDWVEEDPQVVAEEHVALYGGGLGFVYRYALRGYSIHDLSDAGAEGIRADPRVEYVEHDHYVCAVIDEGGCPPIPPTCGEGCPPPPPTCGEAPECIVEGTLPAPPIVIVTDRPHPPEPIAQKRKPKRRGAKKCGKRGKAMQGPKKHCGRRSR